MLTAMSGAAKLQDPEDRLRRIETVTDTTLAYLSVEELLQELLDRVRDILEADAATVLLLTESGQHLVVTASSGIEEAVRQGVQVRVGDGFAGRVAAERKPLVIDRVDSSTVVNPLLWKKGLQALAGVPLLVEAEMLGILHIGTLQPGGYTDQDIHLLRLVADRIALATRARLSHGERVAASALQRALLPGQLPQVSGMEFSVRYVPDESAGVSGDWYDVFTLPSGALCVTIGDVVGRGLPAAITMGRIRTALRSYALESDDPGDMLNKLDRYIRHFEPGAMATIACGVLESSLERLHLSLAGHPAPVLSQPEKETRLADVPVDPPIGVGLTAPNRRSTMIEIPYDTTAVFYTDGLVERRHRPIEEGIQLLCESVHSGPTEAVCAEVMAKLTSSDTTHDDIALLAMRRQDLDELRTMDLDVDAVPGALATVRFALRRWLPGVGASEDDVADLLVATGEACANVVEHAYGPAGGTLSLHVEAHSGGIWARISDTGAWRSPRGTHRGRGTELMRRLCDDVRVESGASGTDVFLRKRLSGESA